MIRRAGLRILDTSSQKELGPFEFLPGSQCFQGVGKIIGMLPVPFSIMSDCH